MIIAIFGGWVGVADGFVLLALFTLLLLAGQLLILRGHRRTLEAATRLEGVDLTAIVTRHLPLTLRTNLASQEVPLLTQAVERKIRTYRRMLLGFVALAVLATPAAGFATYKRIKDVEVRFAAAQGPAALDVLKIASGTWGRKHDTLLSCAENPVTITLSNDRKKVSARLLKPTWNGSKDIGGSDYDVIGTQRNELLLSPAAPRPKVDRLGKPLELSLVFTDQDTHHLRRSDDPAGMTGDLVRCRE